MTAIAARTPLSARFVADASVAGLLNRARRLATIVSPCRPEPPQPHAHDLDRYRSEHVRWFILRGLDAATPIGASQGILLHLLHGMYPDMGTQELCHELEHLELRGLAVIHRIGAKPWLAEATEQGASVVGYRAPCPAGIYRPECDQF